MASNNNIFNVSNPAKILQGLWQIISPYQQNLSDILIFLPTKRAIRCFENMLYKNLGNNAVLPVLVPLGSGVDYCEDEDITDETAIITNTERLVVLSKLLSADSSIGSIASALPIAHDLIRLQDYLANNGKNIRDINWTELVDEKYAKHFQHKAQI
ncbi:MAG: hypothetical protein MJ158_04600, partial [Alphaproteobacteria bacterium]|nr:hypothetical protein [Alphaproteobacteria bacterium]